MTRTNQERYLRDIAQTRIAAYVDGKKKAENMDPQKIIDSKIRNQGKLLFEAGLFLEDAPEELRNNSVFIEGYESAKAIKQEVYDLGVQNFVNGVKFKDISKIYQNNDTFMQGYRDARDQSLIDGIDWRNIPDEFYEDGIEKGRRR